MGNKLFSWFGHSHVGDKGWNEVKNDREFVMKHKQEIRKSHYDDLRRYNNNKDDRLKI
jgi:hypothetical protein